MKVLGKEWCLAALLVGLGGPVGAQNHLDGAGDLLWSPDAVWVAFNWPNEEELIVVHTEEPRAYILRPVGEIELNTELVLSAAAPKAISGPQRERIPRLLPSPGRGRLQPLGWSPDSRNLVYRCTRGERALLNVDRGMVTAREPLDQRLPWEEAPPRRVAFQLITQAGDPYYTMQVIDGDGAVQREMEFTDRQEVILLSGARFGMSTFLAPDGQSLVYPRRDAGQWYLLQEPVENTARDPLRLLIGEERPVHWQLAPGNGHLAVVTRKQLLLGAVRAWAEVRSMPVRNAAVQLRWSATGDFLAIEDQHALWVWGVHEPQPRQVSADCAPRFWGWRDGQLMFGQAHASVADLRAYRPTKSEDPQRLAKPPRWQTAPRLIAVSPDGRKLAAVVNFLDAASRSFWQVWSTDLGNGDDWALLLASRETAARRR